MSRVLYDICLGMPEVTVPDDIVDAWQEHLKDSAERINRHRIAKVGTPQDYQGALVSPSVAGFAGYIKPDFVSRKGVRGAQCTVNQRVNLEGSFDKFDSKTKFAFATPPGGGQSRFQDQVDQAKKSWASGMAKGLYRITGSRSGGLGLSSIATRYLSGDMWAPTLLRGCDRLIEGDPRSFCRGRDYRGWRIYSYMMINQATAQFILMLQISGVMWTFGALFMEWFNRFRDEEFIDPLTEYLEDDLSWIGFMLGEDGAPGLRIRIKGDPE